MKQLTAFTFLCCCFQTPAVADNDSAEHRTSIEFADRVFAITDVVLAQHIDPPTRQQMILEGVKALYVVCNKEPPRQLGAEISALLTKEQLIALLDRVQEKLGPVNEAEMELLRGLLQPVPGDASLIDAKESQIAEQLLSNRYVGIGVRLGRDHRADDVRSADYVGPDGAADLSARRLTVFQKILYNGPAWAAGAKQGDVILAIDGEAMLGKNTRQVVDKLRGEAGSDVTLILRQPGEDPPRTLTMTRGRVFIPTIEGSKEESEGQWTYAFESAPDIALIRVVSIGPSTLYELRQVDAALRNSGVRGIVFDLREGEGIMHDAILVADALLDGGTIGHVRSVDGRQKYEAQPGALFQDLPMAVVIARRSNTDRVFLAAALQDSGRAVVVGEPAAGETYVNSIVEIPGRSEKLRLATGVVQRADGTTLLPRSASFAVEPELIELTAFGSRPARRDIVIPDHRVPADSVAFSINPLNLFRPAASDPMLAKAVEVLRKRSAAERADAGQRSLAE